MGDVYLGCIAYADDIILLSASLSSLQKMLDICYSCSSDLDIIFNPKKSCLFCIGKDYNAVLPNLRLCNTDVFWCNKLKYLGLTFVSGKKN